MTSSSLITLFFDAPARLQEFKLKEDVLWNERVSNMLDRSVKGYKEVKINDTFFNVENNCSRSQFFNPAKTFSAPDLIENSISWVVFPKHIDLVCPSDRARWKAADQNRHVQDEFCEWSVSKSGKNITSVTFTCETPEYWEFLSYTNPAKVLELYQTYINREVKKEDLFDEHRRYIPQNKWNKDTKNGAMHLIQENNTLSAAIELVAGASVVRKKSGRVIEEQQELIQSGRYGDIERHSDASIGAKVNSFTRRGAQISIQNPVGVYFDKFDPIGWKTPDGSDPKSYWHIERGTKNFPLRFIYTVPPNKKFTVSDITINGRKIEYGSQIADFVRLKLVTIAQNFKQENNVRALESISYQKAVSTSSNLVTPITTRLALRSFPQEVTQALASSFEGKLTPDNSMTMARMFIPTQPERKVKMTDQLTLRSVILQPTASVVHTSQDLSPYAQNLQSKIANSTFIYGSKDRRVFEKEVSVDGSFKPKGPEPITLEEIERVVREAEKLHILAFNKAGGMVNIQTRIGNVKTVIFGDNVNVNGNFEA